MNSRLQSLLCLSALIMLVGCGSLKRTGKDLVVVATSPVTVPLSATYDSLDWEEHTNTATPVVLFPFNRVAHAVKHTAYTALHAGDLAISPLYILGSAFTSRNDLEPIDLYYLDQGYPWASEPWPALEE